MLFIPKRRRLQSASPKINPLKSRRSQKINSARDIPEDYDRFALAAKVDADSRTNWNPKLLYAPADGAEVAEIANLDPRDPP